MKETSGKQTKITQSIEETASLGFSIGQACRGGEVFLLNGDLGAGKTSFLQGLGAGLGIKDKINSPTFNILKIYKGKGLNFCHIDAYRLNSGQDLENIGLSDYLNDKKTITAIEWADRVKSAWPNSFIKIDMLVKSENEREISIEEISNGNS